ncbi:MAG: hypothetical protein QGH94_15420 [Phycisphaerae bacterium]|nr:hypothetical protein [Phycisphaerae bacterium]
MKDQNDTTRRAEDLLRQWGASQAAEQAAAELTAPVAPRPSQKLTAAPPSRARAGVLLRWVPVGLAASLLLAAGVLFMSTAAAPRYSIAPAAPEPAGGPDSPTAVAPASKPADLSEELAAARNDAAEARDALARELARNKASDLQIK